MLPAVIRRAATGAAAVLMAATLVPTAPAYAAARCPDPAADIVRSAPGAGKTVALTFDDGPTRFTPQILATLRKYDVRATFFQTGAHVSRQPELARQVVAEGHLLGDHTYDHDYPSQVHGGWTASYLDRQLDRTNRLQRRVSGGPTCFFRPPGGFQSPGMIPAARSRHMSTVMWSVDTEDWTQPAHTSEAATDRIVATAEAGIGQSHPIVLMHDGKASHEPESQVSSNRSNTVAALSRIIRFYQSHGYRFVDLLGRSGLPPAPTTLAMTTRPTKVPAGTRVTALSGTLRAITGPVAGQRVRWYSRDKGGAAWRLRGSVKTNRHGHVTVVDRPTRTTEYRLSFRGSRRYAATAPSGTRTVTTFTYPTQVTAVPDLGSLVTGQALTITGRVVSNGHARGGTSVTVTAYVDGQTEPAVTTVTTRSDGTFTFSDIPAASTRYVLTVGRSLPYDGGSAAVDVTVSAADPADPAGDPVDPSTPDQ